jgi:dihydropteroate synthase
MGILNVTPDSFSDGGEFESVQAAVVQAQRLAAAGVDLLDIGGESTRPGAEPVTAVVERDRVIPVIQALRQQPQLATIPISIDTTKASVATAAVQAGADIVNDVSAGTVDVEMLSTVARLAVPIILMHRRGTPQTMQQLTDYQDLVPEILSWLQGRIEAAIAAGIAPSQIAVDPGIGFAKNTQQNLELLRRLAEFQVLQCPLLLGVSRKRFIGTVLNQGDPKQRGWGTAAACTAAIAGGADILRVHDVASLRDVARVADAIWRGWEPPQQPT